MNRRLIVPIIVLSLFCTALSAQTLTACRDSVAGGYNFWLYSPGKPETVPTVSKDGRLPLIVFLHGKSLSGSDLSRVRRYGPLHALALGREIDAFVLAPQTSNGWSPSRVDKTVSWVETHYPVDTNRIYVIGMSMGGYGTIDYAGSYPEKIAAAMAICGGGDLKNYLPLRQVPLWILHGTADTAVGINESKKVIDGMNLEELPDSENRLIFTKLVGADHSRPGRLLYMKQVYEWLLSHSLADPERPVCRDYKITNSTLDSAYKDMRTGHTYFKVIDKH